MEYELYKKTEVTESLYDIVRSKLIWAFAVRSEGNRFFIKRMIGFSHKETRRYIESILGTN